MVRRKDEMEMWNRGKQAFALLAVAAALLTGCGRDTIDHLPQDEKGEQEVEAAEEEVAAIEDWNGTWNSLLSLADGNEELAGLSGQLGRGAEERYASELKSIRMFKNSMSVYSELHSQDGTTQGDLLQSLSYDYRGAATADGETWHQFETSTESPYRYLLLKPVEERKGGLRCFTFRYGEEGFESLLEQSGWNPVMVSFDATLEQLKDSL